MTTKDEKMSKIFIGSGSMEKLYLKQKIQSRERERESEEQDNYCKSRRFTEKGLEILETTIQGRKWMDIKEGMNDVGEEQGLHFPGSSILV